MSDLNELPLGQKSLIENFDQTQDKLYDVILHSCVEKFAIEGFEDSNELREIILQKPERLDEKQRHSLGVLFRELIALKRRLQNLEKQIDNYVPRAGLPGHPNPISLAKYGCPKCAYTKYQCSPQQLLTCSEHKMRLVRKPIV